MDDDLQQLEAELKRLRPAAPSRAVHARLARELATAAPARAAASLAWLWTARPAAAAIALLAALVMRRDIPPPAFANSPAALDAGARLKPVAAENVLYAARDEGFVRLDDGTTARRERLNYVDTYTWKNPRTNASLKWSVPREEIRVVPVNFQ
jgi:hypothetical protein